MSGQAEKTEKTGLEVTLQKFNSKSILSHQIFKKILSTHQFYYE